MRLLPRFLVFLAMLAAAAARADDLPAPLLRALQQAGVPPSAVAVFVQDLAQPRPLLAWRADESMNPASVMKLVTTYAALDLLGPAFTWKTEALGPAPGTDGVLAGDLVLRGTGDPRFTLEDFWLLLRELRARGVADIRGDLVLDASRFEPGPADPSAFDGQGWRAYNVPPGAVMVAHNAVNFRFIPDTATGRVRLLVEPDLPEITVRPTLELKPGPCPADWRSGLGTRVEGGAASAIVTFDGSLAADCGEKDLNLNLLSHEQFTAAVFRRLWRELGGTFGGGVRNGAAPAGAIPLATRESRPLGEIVRDINKQSNNVMARQLFLTLGAERAGVPGTPARAAEVIARWMAGRGVEAPELRLENGSGLSRLERISAGHLGALLAAAWAGPVQPEFAASLAIAGLDGTLKSRLQGTPLTGRTHLKTGLLDGVRGLAGYVLDRAGRRMAVVLLINHPQAGAADAAQDALLGWLYERG